MHTKVFALGCEKISNSMAAASNGIIMFGFDSISMVTVCTCACGLLCFAIVWCWEPVCWWLRG